MAAPAHGDLRLAGVLALLNQTLTVLLYASLAVGAAAFGAAPLLFRRVLPVTWIGWANATAAGLMLGVAYLLMTAALAATPAGLALGAVAGIGFIALAHRAAGLADLDLNRLDPTPPEYGYQVLLVTVLHAAPEGMAIGGAMAVSPALGLSTAVALAVHNVPEGTVLAGVLAGRGVRAGRAAALAVAAKLNQVLLAVATYAVVSAAPAALPVVLGVAVGALVYLVMAELLPESYRQAGRRAIALTTMAAMAVVVLR